MAKKEAGLRLDLLDKMFKRLDDIHKKLIKINVGLDKIEKSDIGGKVVSNVSELSKNLDELSFAIKSMSANNLSSSLKSLTVLFDREFDPFLKSIKTTMSEFEKMPWRKWRRSFVRFKKFIQTALLPIIKVLEASSRGISPGAIAAVFSSLTMFINSAMKIAKELGGLSAFSGLPFGKIGKSMKRLKKLIEIMTSPLRINVSPEKVEALASFFKAMGLVLGEVIRFIKIMDKLKMGMAGAIKTAIKLRILLNAVSVAMSTSAKRLRKFSAEKLKSMSAVFRGFGQILIPLRRMIETATKISFVKAKTTAIKMGIMFKSLGKMFASMLKSVKKLSPSQLNSTADVFIALGKFFTAMSRSGAGGVNVAPPVVSFRDWQPVFDSINKLNISRKTKKNIGALRDLAPILASLGEGGAGVGGVRGFNRELSKTDDIVDDVSKGVLKAVIRIELFRGGLKLLTKAVKTLNAISILAGAAKRLQQLSRGVRELGTKLKDIGRTVRDAGQNLIKNFGVGKLFQSEAFGAATAFDKIGTQLEVFGGLTKEARESAEAFAFEIGIKYPLSANEALAATLDLIKAGQGLEETKFILPAAADLAALSDTGNLEATVTTLIAAQAGFEKFSDTVVGTFENIEVAANLISAGADISTASVESLSQGLANVGPAANAFGLSLEDTIAVLSIFDENAIRGAEGGTALRSMLNALGSEKTAKNLQELGISLFDPDTGARKPLNDIINDISAALDAMSPEEQASAMQGLADTFGRQGLQVLLNQGADGINAVVESMQEVAPVSQRAGEMLDNLAGDIVQLQGSFETFMTKALLPLITRFARPFIKLVRLIVDSLLALDKRVLAFVSTMITLISVGATVIGMFLIFLGVIVQLGGLLLILVGGLLNVVNIFFLLVGGVVASVTVIAALVSVFAFLLPVMIAVTSLFEGLFQIFSKDLGGASTAVTGFFSELKSTLVDIGSAIVDIFGSIFFFLKQGQGSVSPLERVGEVIAGLFDSLTAVLQSGLISKFRNGLRDLAQIFKVVVDVFTLPARIAETEASLREAGRQMGESTEEIDNAIRRMRIKMRLNLGAIVSNAVANNKLLQRAFGDKLTAGAAQNFFKTLGELGVQARNDLGEIGTSFKDFVSNVKSRGLSKGIDTLSFDLDRSFGRLLATTLEGVQAIFGIDFSEEINQALANRGGFTKAIPLLFSRMTENLRKQAIKNRPELKKLFTKVMTFFLSPIRAVGFFGKLFGIKPLEDFANEFNKMLEDAFGAIFDFVFNLLEGQPFEEAAVNAFGGAVTPVLDFVNELARAAGLIFDILGDVISNLFNFGDSGAGESVGGVIEAVFSTLSGFLKGINDLILTPLAEGDLLGAAANLLPLVFNFLQSVGQGIFDIVSTIDVPQIFLDVAGAVFELLFTALNSGVEELGLIFKFDVTSILDTIAATMDTNVKAQKAGGPGGVFTLAAASIVGLFATALTTAFGALGSLLDIDTDAILAAINDSIGGVLTAIENLFIGEEGTNIFDSIGKIISNFRDALSDFFALFTSGEGSDTSNMENSASALQILANGLGQFIDLGVGVLTSAINAIDRLFELLAETEPSHIVAIGLALVIFAGGLTAVAIAVSRLIVGLATIASFLVVLLALKAVLDNIEKVFAIFEDLVKLDVAGFFGSVTDALGSIAIDMLEGIVKFLGVEELFEELTGIIFADFVADLRIASAQLAVVVEDFVTNLISSLGRVLERTILDMRGRLAKAIKDLGLSALGIGDDALVAVSQFFEAERISLADLFEFREDEGFDLREAKRFAAFNVDKLMKAFTDEFDDFTELTPEMQTAIDTLAELGVMDEIFHSLLAKGDADTAVVVAEALRDSGDISAAVDGVIRALELGIIDEAPALNIMETLFDSAFLDEDTRSILKDKLEELGVDTEGLFTEFLSDTLENMLDGGSITFIGDAVATLLFDAIQDGLDEETVLQLFDNVTPDLTAEEKASVWFKVQALLTEVNTVVTESSEGETITITPEEIVVDTTDTTVTLGEDAVLPPIFDEALLADVGLDISDLADPEEVEELNEQLEILTTRLQLLQTEFMETQPLLAPFIEDLLGTKDAIVEVTESYTAMITTILMMTLGPLSVATFVLRTFFLQSLQRVVNTIDAIRLTFPQMVVMLATESAKLGGAISGVTALATALQNVSSSFDNVQASAAAALSAVMSFFGFTGGGGAAPSFPGREFGGLVKARNLYEVIEGGRPELLAQGGKTFLLPGQDGVVIPSTPLASLGGFSSGVPLGAAAGVGGNSSMVINIGGVTVGDISGTDIDAPQLVTQIESLQNENRQRALEEFSVNDQLRSRHRR